MKKLLIIIAVLTLTITLSGCTKEVEVEVEKIVYEDVIVEVEKELPTIPALVTMADVDAYLGRPDIQYVDLRDFDDKMAAGYIAGFEFIPFFDYLENQKILVRDGDWDFTAADLKNAAALEALFDADKTIFLMCGSGTRAGYVKAALESIGYTNVINVGGIGTYLEGDAINSVPGDDTYVLSPIPEIPAEVTMANIDAYLGRADVQYVDLRNFDDKMAAGYIAGFEFIPFFDYLEYESILVRDGDWNFTATDIKNASALEALFDADKTIFLMCGSGTRAGYVKAALESIGYTNVINVGGIGTYLEGAAVNSVLGDDVYTINMDKKGDFTPGTYFGYDPVGGYQTTVVIGPSGGIVNVIFDAVNGDSTKQNDGFDYGMVAYGGAAYEWFQHADMLADYVVANQGWGEIVLDEADLTGLNALTVGHHFLTINHDVEIDAIAGVTIGAEGFVLSWNSAIAQASSTDLAVVATTQTPAEWAAAHAAPYTYTDGTYLGMDEASGYSAVVTIEGGMITDVFFDAIVVTTTIVVDPLEVDPDEVEVTNYTTKQVLGFDYNMAAYSAATLEWFEQANLLGSSIVDSQMWAADWTIVEGNFDGLVDAVAGVTIGVDSFKLAFDEALLQAVPAE